MQQGLAAAKAIDIVCNDVRDLAVGLLRDPCNVRSGNHVWQSQERIVGRNRFFPIHIQACARETTARKRGIESVVIEKGAARGVYQVRAIGQGVQDLAIDYAARLTIQPETGHQNIGCAKARKGLLRRVASVERK